MADDDDDEAFGDFTFAASSSSISHLPQIIISNDAPTSRSKTDADDDEWGDFVTPTSNSAANQSTWSDLKYGDSSSSVADWVVPDRVKEEEKGVRARGALPLSLFGDEECEEVVKEEEEKGSCGVFGFGGGEGFRGRKGELPKKGSDLSGLLASLYDQGGVGGGRNGNILDLKENGLKKELDVNGVSMSGSENGKMIDMDESSFDFGVGNSGSDGFSFSAKAFDQGEVIKVENGRRTKSDESVFNFLSDGFSFGANPSNAAASDKTDNRWGKSKYELDFNFSTPELGNEAGSIGGNIGINGPKIGIDNSSTEDNDDDEWDFQGNTNVSVEQDDGRQWKLTGDSDSTLNNGLNLDSKESESVPNELQINSSKEDETQGKWEFMDFAAPSVKQNSSEIWNFHGNGIPSAKENKYGVWDFQGVALPTANDEHNCELAFVDDSNTSAKGEDDGGWEFQAAPVDQKPKQDWNMGVQSFGAQGATLTSDTQVDDLQLESSQKTNFVQKVDSGIDSPTGVSASPGHEFGFDSFVSSTVLQKESVNDSVSEGNRYETENQSTFVTFHGSVDADDSYWDLKDSFPETNLKKGNKADGGEKGALPPSLFSDEPLDSIDPLNQNVFSFKSSESHSNGFKNIEPSASLSDLILNLYNKSEKKYSAETPEKPNSSGAIQVVNDSTLSDDEDDFDGTWDFKDASLSSIIDEQSPCQAHESSYTVSKIENLVDFYCKLKDQSSLAARCHLASLKEAKSIAEDSRVEALDEKIQDALEELKKANLFLEDAPENCKAGNCFNELHQVLSKPKFKMLESEYGLSRRLSEAEKDLKSAIELVEHAASVLKLLSMGSAEQQSSYISTWMEILFVCAQELQHGASIWQRAVDKSVHTQILSQIEGKKFVRALGEIFRVVLILEASSKAYKPWILSNSTHGDNITALLNECSTIWSISGLNQAMKELIDPVESDCVGEVQALAESINHMRDLDVSNASLRPQHSVCGLSLLNREMIPDVKMVVWNEEHFFLPLANLWANLISSDPPLLPRIHAG